MRLRFSVILILGCFAASMLFSQQQTRSFQGITNSSQTFQFDQFSGLTLQSAEIRMSIAIRNGYLGLDNDAAFSQDIQAAAGVQISVRAGQAILSNRDDQPLFSQIGTVYSEDVTLTGDNGDGPASVDLSAPDGKVIQPGALQSDKTEQVGDSFLNLFQGNGSITLNIDFNNFFQMSDSQEVTQAGSPFEFDGEITVIYH